VHSPSSPALKSLVLVLLVPSFKYLPVLFAILFLAAVIAAASAQYVYSGYGGYGYGLGYSNLGYSNLGYGYASYPSYAGYASPYYGGLAYYKK